MVDTTHRNTARHAMELDAYNAAFYQLGLRWYWDTDIYERLLDVSDRAADRTRWYLQTHQAHLLTAYDADFLVNAIEAAKAAYRKTEHAAGTPPSASFDWATLRAAETGI